MAWTCALKYTEAELELISDPDIYLMIENNMRGGIATISHRQAVANNPLVDGYDPSEPNSWIQYLDANNLYGCSMSEPLPVGKFRFLEEQEIESFDVSLLSIPADADTGYIVECDLTYLQTFHQLHNAYRMHDTVLSTSPRLKSTYA